MFGLEVTIRSLLKKPFAPRGRWNVTICLSVVGLLLLVNLLVAILDRSSNFCITSLFWFLAHYSVGCFGLLVGISALLLVCAVVVFVRLHRSNKVELVERAAASKMVYYMALAIISEVSLP